MSLSRNVPRMLLGTGGWIWLSLSALTGGFPLPAVAQSEQTLTGQSTGVQKTDPQGTKAFAGESTRQSKASVIGTVIDQAGAVVVGAHVQITRADQFAKQEVTSGDNGQFSFANLSPGLFQLTVAATGFDAMVLSGTLGQGEFHIVPVIVLPVARAITQVQVRVTQVDVAQEQIKEQEKQRVLGFFPNFYVSYNRAALPLNPRQKFRLAWKTTTDPFTFVGVAAVAGVEQAANAHSGYGQGWDGYAKRLGASYADAVTGTFIGSAILPSLLKQDPRYFYKGTGSTGSRLLYALASPVICKGDNMSWQPNYSNVAGAFASAGISYAYYPKGDRNGATLVFQNSLIRLGEMAFEGVLQEFLIRRLTPHLRNRAPDGP